MFYTGCCLSGVGFRSPRWLGDQNNGEFWRPTHRLLLAFNANFCRILHRSRVITPFVFERLFVCRPNHSFARPSDQYTATMTAPETLLAEWQNVLALGNSGVMVFSVRQQGDRHRNVNVIRNQFFFSNFAYEDEPHLIWMTHFILVLLTLYFWLSFVFDPVSCGFLSVFFSLVFAARRSYSF